LRAAGDFAVVACLRLLLVFSLATSFAVPLDIQAASTAMKGPAATQPRSVPEAPDTGINGTQPLLGAIRFFQRYISPTDGARCQFAPTCSAFGHQAIRDHGAWTGVLMTADRLMRCSYMTNAADYPHLPNGRLADPVAANLLEE
jgi:putative membrane protein insertion efficiency factor